MLTTIRQTMKRYLTLTAVALLFALTTTAQNNVWEKPDLGESTTEVTKTKKAKKEKKVKATDDKDKDAKPVKVEKPKKEKVVKLKQDPKYLRGAVPMVDGKVCFTLDLDQEGKSAQQLYDAVLQWMADLTRQPNQLEGSAVSLVNKTDHIIVAQIREWLVFKDQFVQLDRAKFFFTLVATCTDGHLTVTMDRISYRYGEAKPGVSNKITAEEMITDDWALNKKGSNIYKGCQKWRKKTIDRKDALFDDLTKTLGLLR